MAITFSSKLHLGFSWTLWKALGVYNLTIFFSIEIGAHILVEKFIVTISVLIVGCVDLRSYVLK